MRACWLKWVGRDWSISADYIWLNYSDANNNRERGPFFTNIFAAINPATIIKRASSIEAIRLLAFPQASRRTLLRSSAIFAVRQYMKQKRDEAQLAADCVRALSPCTPC